jgi:hypothetical protein
LIDPHIQVFCLEISDFGGWFKAFTNFFSMASIASPCPSNGFAFAKALCFPKIAQWLIFLVDIMDHYPSVIDIAAFEHLDN